MVTLIIFSAQYLIVLLLLGVLARGLVAKPAVRREVVLRLIISGLIAAVLAKLGGYIYNDPRPFVVGHFTPLIPHGADNGFPSDHVMLGLVASLAIFQLDRRLSLALAAVALWVGIARVLSGIHHFQDVAGSIVIALLSVWLTSLIIRLLSSKKA